MTYFRLYLTSHPFNFLPIQCDLTNRNQTIFKILRPQSNHLKFSSKIDYKDVSKANELLYCSRYPSKTYDSHLSSRYNVCVQIQHASGYAKYISSLHGFTPTSSSSIGYQFYVQAERYRSMLDEQNRRRALFMTILIIPIAYIPGWFRIPTHCTAGQSYSRSHLPLALVIIHPWLASFRASSIPI